MKKRIRVCADRDVVCILIHAPSLFFFFRIVFSPFIYVKAAFINKTIESVTLERNVFGREEREKNEEEENVNLKTYLKLLNPL